MAISDNSFRIALSAVFINREARARERIDTRGLRESLHTRGQIHPIVVKKRGEGDALDLDLSQPYELVAGECRHAALSELTADGMHDGTILCRLLEDLGPLESKLIELEENIKRSDFEWDEVARHVKQIHQLNLALDPEWTMGDTAKACCLSLPTVSQYMQVAQALEATTPDAKVTRAGGMKEAYNILQRQAKREAAGQLEALIGPARAPASPVLLSPGQVLVPGAPRDHQLGSGPGRPDECILNLDFAAWAEGYSGDRFNFVHCDFPYGVNYNAGPQGQGAEPGGKGYSDDPQVYQKLLAAFCTHLDKFMSLSAHLMFWMTADSEAVWQTLEFFRIHAPSLRFAKKPLIWFKSDNAGVSPDPRRQARHVYELALFASRGDRQLVQVKADTYAAPTNHDLHPSTKPKPMLRHFFEMLVDSHTSILDPTCGSGAALRAAESLGASRCLGLEVDRNYCDIARRALGEDRGRAAAAGLTTEVAGL